MTIAKKVGKTVGTGLAYAVHYMGKTSSPAAVIGLVYANRDKIKKFAVKHALDKSSSSAIQDNLLECLQYID